VDAATVAWSVVGVLAIGTINLLVSFSLALYVAMKSQRVRFMETPALVGKLLERFRTTPRSFFVPPPETPAEAT
jgi:site-specific recombinase